MSKILTRSAIGNFNIEDGFKVSGNPIVYDERTDRGSYYEVIQRGALDYADLSDISLLVNHDYDSVPLARYRAGDESSTMSISTSDKGLFFTATLDEKNPDCQKIHSALSRSDLSKMSFGFIVDWEDPEATKWIDDGDKPTCIIRKIEKVLEVSIVTWPAYEGTSVSLRNNNIEESKEDVFDIYKRNKEQEAFELEKARFMALL